MKRKLTAAAIAVIGSALILAGAQIGQADSLMKKAVNICLECIGLG